MNNSVFPDQPDTVQQSHHVSGSNKPLKLILTVLLTAVVAGSGGYLLGRANNKSIPTFQTTVTEPSPTKSVSSQCTPRLTPTPELLTKLSLWLRGQISRDDQEHVIEVFIGLRDDEKPSPMPKLQYPLPVIRNHQLIISPTNQAIMEIQDAMYKEQLQRWKKSQDAFTRKLASLGLVKTKQDWESPGFFAKLPVCNVLTVAQQPEVTSIIEAPGGERLRLN